MWIRERSFDRPVHLGPYPLESLERAAGVDPDIRASLPEHAEQRSDHCLLAATARKYAAIYTGLSGGPVARKRAPVPEDPTLRSADIKGLAYFLDASQVGICAIPDYAWLETPETQAKRWAVILLVEFGRLPEAENLANAWVGPALSAVADMRAQEIAAVVAGHIRAMGWPADHALLDSGVLDLGRLCVLAGLAVGDRGVLKNPYLGTDYALAAVATEYPLAADSPLAAGTLDAGKGLRYWWGINGARSGRERNRRLKRATHLSNYPMETVKGVERPTTSILDDEVPRVPKRAAFFERALRGDLGEKARRERGNFAFKHPSSHSLLQCIRALVPHQDGPVADVGAGRYSDPEANAKAVKSLSYFLGADLTGICEIPDYAWYSHRENGEPIDTYHRYAVVMLIDQGYETMEGASGDDWISGSQSMRAYLRGAEIAGVMAAQLRDLGFSSRSQTNADSDVLHIPLILWAGLGELSRIGELVLNPFVGPRFKSVVLTTNMPLAVDRPIDFGLQYFCRHCLKCARECPCDAISWGDSVMFNGYEMWKLDVERCTRYRLTNSRGAACGRCMKTCPINKVVDADGALLTRAASWLGIHAQPLKPLLVRAATWFDDWVGNGRRNPAKKWWLDQEIVDGVTVLPKATNQRDIDPTRHIDKEAQKIAYYNADVMPAPDDTDPVPLVRKAALHAAEVIETPAQARARRHSGRAAPSHYAPTPPRADKRPRTSISTSPYAKDS